MSLSAPTDLEEEAGRQEGRRGSQWEAIEEGSGGGRGLCEVGYKASGHTDDWEKQIYQLT